MATASNTATVTANPAGAPGTTASNTATVTASNPGTAASNTATVTAFASGAKITATRTTAWNVYLQIIPYLRRGGAFRAATGYRRIAGVWVRFTNIPPAQTTVAAGRSTTWAVAAATGTTTWQQRLQQATVTNPKRVSIIGDSIMFGAASTGVSNPKWLNSPPGRLRTSLAAQYGDAGTGVVICNNASNGIHANPAYDPRWIFTGSITDTLLGYFKQSVFSIPVGANSVSFSCGNAPSLPVDFFKVHILSGTTGSADIQVDSGTVLRVKSSASSTVDIAPNQGTFPTHYVTTFGAGGLGAHTLKISANGGTVQLFAVEALRTGQGRFIIDNLSISGKSLAQFVTSDNSGGTFGLPFIDTLRSDLLWIELAANDWQAGTATATTTANMALVVNRQRALGLDVAMLIPPVASDVLQPAGGPTQAQYRTALLGYASANSVPILDLSALWSADPNNPTYEEGNALGKYADTVHPSDSGAIDIAAAMETFLGL